MRDSRKIVELMRRPRAQHDETWLKESLQAAVELEFSTVPPYLCAYWSVKSGSDPVAMSIREILLEEMLHMGIACNLLVALGETPKLTTAVPEYPGPLPGGVNPELIVHLEGLSDDSLRTFMEIEFPEHEPVAWAADETIETIGEFYGAVLEAFERLNPPLSQDRQLDGWLGLSKVTNLAEVRNVVDLIKHQGEGSKESPEENPGDLAHYYRFGEILHRKRLRKNQATGTWEYTGADLPFPDVYPMAKVPSGGYSPGDVAADVQALLSQFDVAFSEMLRALEAAWRDGDVSALDTAVFAMSNLPVPAIQVMQIPIPGGGGSYGPCFRYVAAE